eukprot:EG_transcript_1875
MEPSPPLPPPAETLEEAVQELKQELKKKNKLIEELELKCEFLEGKDARSKRSLEDLAKSLYTEILLLREQLLSREEVTDQLHLDATEKKKEGLRVLAAQMRDEFQKEKLLIHERYQRTVLEIYSKLKGSSAPLPEASGYSPGGAAKAGFGRPDQFGGAKTKLSPRAVTEEKERRMAAERTLAMFLDVPASVLEVRDAAIMTASCVTRSGGTSTDDLDDDTTSIASDGTDSGYRRRKSSVFGDRPAPTRAIRNWQRRRSNTPRGSHDSDIEGGLTARSELMKKAQMASRLATRFNRAGGSPKHASDDAADDALLGGEGAADGEADPEWDDEWTFVREASARAGAAQPLRSALSKGRVGYATTKSVTFAKQIEQITPKTAVVRAAQTVVASLRKENLHVCYQLTTTLKELQATEEAMATLKQELATAVAVRDKLAIEVRQKDADLERVLREHLEKTEDLKAGSPETNRRLQEALHSIRGMQRELKDEERTRADADAKWQRRYDALRDTLEKRVRVEKQMRRQYAELRKAVKHFMDRKTPKAEVCAHCLAVGRHVSAMEDELRGQSSGFEETVRRMWGELSQVKAVAKPDGAGLARIYREVLRGLQLFAQYEADGQVLREQLAALKILNEGLEEKVVLLQVELGRCREAAAAQSRCGPPSGAARKAAPTVVTLDGGRVPAKALQLFAAISAQAAARPPPPRPTKAGPPTSAGLADAASDRDAAVKVEAARFVLDLLVRSCEAVATAPDDWEDRKSGWEAAERYIAQLQLPERVVARAQLLLDKLLFRQRMVLLAAASDFPLHPGLRAIVRSDKLAALLPQPEPAASTAAAPVVVAVAKAASPLLEDGIADLPSSLDSGSEAESETDLVAQLVDAARGDGPEDGEEVDLMLECITADADNQRQLIEATAEESFAEVNGQELLLIKEAMQPPLASSKRAAKRAAAEKAKVSVQFALPEAGAGAAASPARRTSKLAQKQSQALAFAAQGSSLTQ